MSLYASKRFPDNYSERVLEILTALSMTGLKGIEVVGSASQRAQLYSSDYDASENVRAKNIPEELKQIIQRVRGLEETYFGDIKCGHIPEYDILASAKVVDGKVVGFNKLSSIKGIDLALEQRAITQEEAKQFRSILNKVTSPLELLEAKKEIRFHILRWTPAQILAGELFYRGMMFTLDQAVNSGGLIKIDVIANIHDRFTECSMIYNVYKGKKLITLQPSPIRISLAEDILYYSEREPFKALKRLYSLTKYDKNEEAAKLILPLLNSDLGRLNAIISDLNTLHSLLELRNFEPTPDVIDQIDVMREKMGNIYLLKDFLKAEYDIIGEINNLIRSPKTQVLGKIERLSKKLSVILKDETLKISSKMIKDMS